jgi:hypothetical protein
MPTQILIFLSLSSLLYSCAPVEPNRLNRFLRLMAQNTWFGVRKCLLYDETICSTSALKLAIWLVKKASRDQNRITYWCQKDYSPCSPSAKRRISTYGLFETYENRFQAMWRKPLPVALSGHKSITVMHIDVKSFKQAQSRKIRSHNTSFKWTWSPSTALVRDDHHVNDFLATVDHCLERPVCSPCLIPVTIGQNLSGNLNQPTIVSSVSCLSSYCATWNQLVALLLLVVQMCVHYHLLNWTICLLIMNTTHWMSCYSAKRGMMQIKFPFVGFVQKVSASLSVHVDMTHDWK